MLWVIGDRVRQHYLDEEGGISTTKVRTGTVVSVYHSRPSSSGQKYELYSVLWDDRPAQSEIGYLGNSLLPEGTDAAQTQKS